MIGDGELRAAIEDATSRRIAGLERRPSRYATSAAIEDVEVELDRGERLTLVLKDLAREARLAGAAAHKPEFLYDPRREIETYRVILARARLGTAQCFAAVADPDENRFWLLLEKVPGVELYQVGELERWRRVASWLAGMHQRLEGHPGLEGVPLLVHDRAYHRVWAERAVATLDRADDPRAPALARRLEQAYDGVIAELTSLPVTVVHGEFQASNVLIDRQGERVCPVDWEMAAVASGLADLAALVSGDWSEDERREIWRAYREALAPQRRLPGEEEFSHALGCARLALCVQWLGWSPGWNPPPEHAHDWLSEADQLLQELAFG